MSGGRGPLGARVMGVALALVAGGSALVATAQAPVDSTMVYTGEVSDISQVFVADFDVDGDPVGPPRQLTDGEEDAVKARPGPDGRILFVRNGDGGAAQVWVMDADGRNEQALVDGFLLNWLADGSGFVYRGAGGLHHYRFPSADSQALGPGPVLPADVAGGADEAVVVSLVPPDSPAGPWLVQTSPLDDLDTVETVATSPGAVFTVSARVDDDGDLQLVLGCEPGGGGMPQVCVAEDGMVAAVTTTITGKPFVAVFPDGRRAAFGAFDGTSSSCGIVDLATGAEVTLKGSDGQPLDCQDPAPAAGPAGPGPTPTSPPPPPELSRPAPFVYPTFIVADFQNLVTAPGGQLPFHGIAEAPSLRIEIRLDGECRSEDCACVGDPEFCEGQPLQRTFTLTPEPDGRFEGSIDTTGLPEGDYLVTFVLVREGLEGKIRRYIRVSAGEQPTPGGDIDEDALRISELLFGDREGGRRGASQGRVFRLTATHAVLGRDDVFADSLAGAPLADTGPLLFTPAAGLLPEVRDELVRILASGSTVYLLGGEAALSPAIVDELTALGFVVERLAGASRIETALAVADEVRARNPDSTHVLVARAFGSEGNPTSAWADAVTGGAYAAAAGVPIVLTATESLHPATAQWFADNPDVDGATLLGGTAALSDAVAAALPGAGRVSGADRAATATAIAAQLWGVPPEALSAYVVVDGYREDGWGYGLASTPLAVLLGAPLLLTNGTAVPDATAAVVRGCDHVDLYLRAASITPEAAAALSQLAVEAC